MTSRCFNAIAAAALMAASAAAVAGSGNAAIEHLQIEVVDLDASDGVAPVVTFHGHSFASSSIAVPSGWRGPVLSGQDQNGTGALDPVVSDSEWDFGGAMALLSGSDPVDGATAASTAHADFSDIPGQTWANLLFDGAFELSPATQLIVSGESSGQSGGSGQAMLSLRLAGSASSGPQEASFDELAAAGLGWQRDFSLVFTNAGLSAASGLLEARLFASAVPEPRGTLAFGLVTFALASGLRRRIGRR